MANLPTIPSRFGTVDVDDSHGIDLDTVKVEFFTQGKEVTYVSERDLEYLPKRALLTLAAGGFVLSESGNESRNLEGTTHTPNQERPRENSIERSKLILVCTGGGTFCGIIITLLIIGIMKFFDADNIEVNCIQRNADKSKIYSDHHVHLYHMNHLYSCKSQARRIAPR